MKKNEILYLTNRLKYSIISKLTGKVGVYGEVA